MDQGEKDKIVAFLRAASGALGHDLIVPQWMATKLKEAGITSGFMVLGPIPKPKPNSELFKHHQAIAQEQQRAFDLQKAEHHPDKPHHLQTKSTYETGTKFRTGV